MDLRACPRMLKRRSNIKAPGVLGWRGGFLWSDLPHPETGAEILPLYGWLVALGQALRRVLLSCGSMRLIKKALRNRHPAQNAPHVRQNLGYMIRILSFQSDSTRPLELTFTDCQLRNELGLPVPALVSLALKKITGATGSGNHDFGVANRNRKGLACLVEVLLCYMLHFSSG